MDEKERSRALGATLGQIEKQFGKGSIIRLGAQAVVAVPAISTGSISVDHALGVGGFPRGRISEIFGPESSGKTTVALQVVAEAQKLGGMAAYLGRIETNMGLPAITGPLAAGPRVLRRYLPPAPLSRLLESAG